MRKKIKLLVLSLTGECNFACVYCYASEHQSQKMSFETAVAAINLAYQEGEELVLQLSGGEPLLAFELIEQLITYIEAKQLKIKVQIQTNASLLTDKIAKFLYAHKVAIGVSLDGRAPVNNKLRKLKNGSGATATILAGIEVLRRNNIATGITCVVTSENVNDLLGIIEMAYYLGNVRKIGFDLLRGQGRGEMLAPASARELDIILPKVYALTEQLHKLTGIKITIAQLERVATLNKGIDEYFGHCYAMNGNAIFVDAGGDIYACSSLVGNQDFYLGNVYKGLCTELQAQVEAKIHASMNFCENCASFKLCGGGCFARWYGNGDKQLYEAECALKKQSIKKFLSKKQLNT